VRLGKVVGSMCTHRYVVPLTGVDGCEEEEGGVVQVGEDDVLAVIPPQQVTAAALQAAMDTASALLSKQPES
jgi:hypothetical protein